MKKGIARLTVLVMVCAVCALTFGCRGEEQTLPAATGDTTVIPDVVVNNNMPDEKSVIVVSGSGEAKAEPDMATVYIAVTTSDETAEGAQTRNTETANAVVEAIKAAGVAEKDIQTNDTYLDEDYDYSEEPAKVVGYTMNNSMKLTIRDVKSVNSVLTAAIAAGATRSYGLEFTVSESSDEYAAALKAAVADAQAKAVALAEAMGVTLEKVPVSVQEGSRSYTAMRVETPMTDSAVAAAAAPSDAAVNTGELTVGAEVTITYAVENSAE